MATETVVVNTNTNVGGVVRAGANQLALIAPLDGAATVSANVVKKYRRASDVAVDHGDGSALHTGAKAALANGLPSVFLVGVTESNAVETSGDSAAVTDSDDADANPLANLPATLVNSVSVDGTSNTIVYVSGDPLVDTVPADTIHINMKTGAWKVGTATSGSGAGVVIDYDYHDWDSAFNQLDLESIEYYVPAGMTFNEQNFGVYDHFVTHAASSNKLVAGAYDSAVAPADVSDVTNAIRSGRLKLLGAHYSGDLVSAFAGAAANRGVNATSKEQLAPAGVTYTDTYTLSDFGAEETPASGTFHFMGANAVFRDRGGSYRISNDRAATGLTDFERFHSTRRSVRYVDNNLNEDLLALRRGSGTAIPYTAAGFAAIEASINATLRRMRTQGIISDGGVNMPSIEDMTSTDRLNRVVNGIEVFITLAGQVHMFAIELNVGV